MFVSLAEKNKCSFGLLYDCLLKKNSTDIIWPKIIRIEGRENIRETREVEEQRPRGVCPIGWIEVAPNSLVRVLKAMQTDSS